MSNNQAHIRLLTAVGALLVNSECDPKIKTKTVFCGRKELQNLLKIWNKQIAVVYKLK